MPEIDRPAATAARPRARLDGRDRRPAAGPGAGPRGGDGPRLGRGRPALPDRHRGRVPLRLPRARARILAAAISDDGSLIALLGRGVAALAPRRRPRTRRRPHGAPRRAAPWPSTRTGVMWPSRTRIERRTTSTTATGRPAGQFETRQPWRTWPSSPTGRSCSARPPYGSIVGVELRPARSGRLAADIAWEEAADVERRPADDHRRRRR